MARNGTRRARSGVSSLPPPMRDASIFGGSPRSAGDAAEANQAPIVLADVRSRVAKKNGLLHGQPTRKMRTRKRGSKKKP